MIVVGGPPGSGKSTAFPVRSFGVDSFNVDDRCRELHGSFQGIPREVRARAGAECEAFVLRHIKEQRDFAVETTMRTAVSLGQAHLARQQGFSTVLIFLATEDPDLHVERVRARALGGGHAAPEREIREIYASSIERLQEAVGVFDLVECFDTTTHGTAPRWVASFRGRQLVLRDPPIPRWLRLDPR
jgi:predicted ABC-type ATPase